MTPADDTECDLPTGEVLEGEDLAAYLAAHGSTASEIAAIMGTTVTEAAIAAGGLTQAQTRRVEHVMLERAIGAPGLAPHVQAARLVLEAYEPERYGRQAGGQGATINVIVDRGGDLRLITSQSGANAIEGEVIPSNAVVRK